MAVLETSYKKSTPSQLELITEGGNTGWRMLGKNPNNYGDIGNNAIDFSDSTGASTTKGATGLRSHAINNSTTASGNSAFAANLNTKASGIYSTALGSGTEASGSFSLATGSNGVAGASGSSVFGVSSQALSYGSMVLGVYPTIGVGQTGTSIVLTDELIKIGNGTGTGSRSDALLILKNGLATVNSTDIRSLDLKSTYANTNSIQKGLNVFRSTSGTAANGIGVSIDMWVEDDGGGIDETVKLDTQLIDVTALSRLGQFDLKVRDGGSIVSQLSAKGNGEVTLPNTALADITTAGNKAIITKEFGDTTYDLRESTIVVYNVGVDVDTTTGLSSIVIPASLNGYNISGVAACIHTFGTTSGAETVDVNITRRRAGADVSVLSTPVTISAATEYYAADGVINVANDDVATGDMLIPVVTNNLDITDATGLTVTISYTKP